MQCLLIEAGTLTAPGISRGDYKYGFQTGYGVCKNESETDIVVELISPLSAYIRVPLV